MKPVKLTPTRLWSRGLLTSIVLIVALCVGTMDGQAQTNPNPYNMLPPTGFIFTGISAGSSVYPNSMQGWKTGTSNLVGISTAGPGGDLGLIPNGSASTPGISNLGTSGINFLSGASAPGDETGEIVVAMRTLGRTWIEVDFIAADQTGGATKQTNLSLQYRIGTTGAFTTVSGATYITSNTAIAGQGTFVNILLPVACENQSVVQLRWIYYESAGQTGPADAIRLDDINVTSHANTAASLTISGTADHGSACPGSSNPSILYTVTDYGGLSGTGLALSMTNTSDFTISTPLSSTTVGSLGGTVSFRVTFNPASPGSKIDTIRLTCTTFYTNSPIIVITGTGLTPAAPVLQSSAATNIVNTTATLNGDLSDAGTCYAATQKGFLYAKTSDNNDPLNGGTGVTKTSVAGTTSGIYLLNVSGLSPSTNYSYRSYIFNGTTYYYGSVQTFTTLDAATGLVFSVSPPATGFSGTNLDAFSVQARRPDNSLDIEYNGMISLSANVISGTGNLSGTTSVAAVAGVANFNNVQFDAAGEYNLTASSGALGSASSSNSIISNGTVPVNFSSIKASQQGNGIAVEWTVSYQLNILDYEVERSTDGRNYMVVATVAATYFGTGANYRWIDASPATGNNFYRIRSMGMNAETKYSPVVNVRLGKGQEAISVFPNPVINQSFNLQFTGKAAGVYYLRLINVSGQVVFNKTINHEGGSSSQLINVDKPMVSGVYQLEIIEPGEKKFVEKVVVER